MRSNLRLSHKQGITFLLFPPWEKAGLVGHGFSTRLGGVSEGPFATLNLGLKGGDKPEAVRKNRQRFLGLWGKDEGDLLYGEQVHGNDVFQVDRDFFNKGRREIPVADALVTSEQQVLLGAFSADCLLVFFLDPIAPAIGLAHAGWRGTFTGILAAVVETMEKRFGSEPGSLEVVMAPSIGPCCYEVGKEVLDFAAASPWAKEAVFYPGVRPAHPYLDLQKTNGNILFKCGVRPDNIVTTSLCTRCRQDFFYSFRGAKGGATGSQMGIIFLR